MLKLSRRHRDHEDVAAEGYAALRRAALSLARGDEAEAGDLLHDTFVRFLLLRPPLDAIGNLDGYLYTMLRNVYLSRQRRHVRRRAVVTESVDVDLLAVMVDGPEPDERLRMRDDLVRLVDHARERTRVSRAASAWILRCVHGYYPAEIARLMKMPARGVDRALHVARREALEELRKPSRPRRDRDGVSGSVAASNVMSGGQRWRDVHARLPADRDRHAGLHGAYERGEGSEEPIDTLQALRIRVFASVDGACLSDAEIAALYRASTGAGDDEPIGTLVMAHVVACAGCLDRINQHLDLPPLKMRDPVESSGTRQRRGGSGGPGDSGGPGGDGGASGAGSVEPRGAAKGGSANRGGSGFDPLLRRTRDTIASIVDHVPRELRIAANGLELGALPVAGVVTVQELAVRLSESLAFVEIFDERGALVCYWPAQVPREGLLDDDITIDLPHGRSIELRVSLMDDCPRLRVRYTDERLGAVAGASRHVRLGVEIDRGVTLANHAGGNADSGDRSGLNGDLDGRSGQRTVRRSPATALAEAARRPLRWWRRLVPSPRFAVVAGALVLLWMILIGPATTWAALAQVGRAAVEAIRTLMSSEPRVAPPAVAAPSATAGPAASPTAVAPPRAPSAARAFTPSELSDLEMAVRVALHDVKADLGEDITLRATSAGVAVHGIVGGAARRDSIARALAGLEGARVDVRTADEVSARARARASRGRASRSTLNTISPAASPAAIEPSRPAEESPAFANALQEALAARMPAPTDRAAFVNETLARADESLARAWALRRLAERYPPRDVPALSRESSQSLAMLKDDHTVALRTAVEALITRVTPLVASAEAIAIKATGASDVSDAAGAPSTTAGTSRADDARLSVMEMFTLMNAWHADAHALLAGAASTPAPREWLMRLHKIQHALQQPGM